MNRGSQCTIALAIGLALCTRAAADPPPAAAPVRQLGGTTGQTPSVQPAPSADSNREALHQAREELHEKLQQAHAKMEEARDQVKQARDQMQQAVDKAPDEARAALAKARAEGHEAMQQARDAVQQARAQLQQALPGSASASDRAERARYARRMAWHTLMHRLHQPSDIPQPMRAELRQHAQRMARLARIHSIASQKHDDAVLKRCDGLIAREQARHKTKMEQLDKALPPPVASAKVNANAPDDDEEGEAEAPAEEPESEDEP